MHSTRSSGWGRRIGTGSAALGVGALAAVAGLSASAPSSAATGEQASPRAGGVCASGYSSGRDLTAAQQLVGRSASGEPANGVASEPVFSRDSRAGRVLAFTSTATNLGSTTGKRNVYVVKRTGSVSADGNAWEAGETVLVSAGGDGDSYGASLSGFTGAGDAPRSARLIAFLSTSTNLPGGNPSGTSAYVANVGGGGLARVKAPGTATGVGVSGDSKVVYVSTTSGLYVRRGGSLKRLVRGSGISHPSTTLNGKQAAYEQNGAIWTVTSAGKRKRVASGNAPTADGGDPKGGSRQGLVRAVSFTRGGAAWRVDARSGRTLRIGTSQTPASINVGGNGVAFGNGANVCLEVRLLDASQRRGGYDIPQGACPEGRGAVTDVAASARYNYLAFSCQAGGLYLHFVGGK